MADRIAPATSRPFSEHGAEKMSTRTPPARVTGQSAADVAPCSRLYISPMLNVLAISQTMSDLANKKLVAYEGAVCDDFTVGFTNPQLNCRQESPSIVGPTGPSSSGSSSFDASSVGVPS